MRNERECAWAASLAFGGWLGCLVGCLACLWRLARLPLAQIRSTEKMAEGIKPDNVSCLVTPGSARQDFLNQSFLKWRATSNNLLCKQSFSWDVFLRTNFNTNNIRVCLSSGHPQSGIFHNSTSSTLTLFLSQEYAMSNDFYLLDLTLTLFLFQCFETPRNVEAKRMHMGKFLKILNDCILAWTN